MVVVFLDFCGQVTFELPWQMDLMREAAMSTLIFIQCLARFRKVFRASLASWLEESSRCSIIKRTFGCPIALHQMPWVAQDAQDLVSVWIGQEERVLNWFPVEPWPRGTTWYNESIGDAKWLRVWPRPEVFDVTHPAHHLTDSHQRVNAPWQQEDEEFPHVFVWGGSRYSLPWARLLPRAS